MLQSFLFYLAMFLFLIKFYADFYITIEIVSARNFSHEDVEKYLGLAISISIFLNVLECLSLFFLYKSSIGVYMYLLILTTNLGYYVVFKNYKRTQTDWLTRIVRAYENKATFYYSLFGIK